MSKTNTLLIELIPPKMALTFIFYFIIPYSLTSDKSETLEQFRLSVFAIDLHSRNNIQA